jgi:hypothetical protein
MLFIVNENLSSGLIIWTVSANLRSTRTVLKVVTSGSYEHVTELSKAEKLEVQLKSELLVGRIICEGNVIKMKLVYVIGIEGTIVNV